MMYLPIYTGVGQAENCPSYSDITAKVRDEIG